MVVDSSGLTGGYTGGYGSGYGGGYAVGFVDLDVGDVGYGDFDLV